MVNALLVVIAVILSLLIIAGSIYILVYFQHPEDKLVAWVPKIVVVLSLSLACFSVLMLPLDVGNGATGGFPMATLWQIVFIAMVVLVVVVIPFATFYYEGDEYDETGKQESQIAAAIKGTLITIVIYAIITVVMYLFLGIVELPVIRLENTFQTTRYREIPLNRTTEAAGFTLIPEESFNCTNFTIPVALNFSTIPINGNFTGYDIVAFSYENNGTVIFNDGNVTVFAFPTFLANRTFNFTDPVTNVTTLITNSTEVSNRTVIYTVIAQKNTTCYYNETDTVLGADPVALVGTKFRNPERVRFRVSIALFIISILVFFGWILFIIFGGIGMVAMPYDCITSWKRRPVRISLEKYVTRKKQIGEQATTLIEKGKAIQDRQRKGKERKRDRQNYNKFRQAVFLLEDEYERLQQCYKRQGGKLILHFLMLVWGIISVGLTIMWLLHIILYVFTYPYPFSPFLNTMLIKLDDAWGFLGVIVYGLFSFYLLLCCIKGNFKFGMRLFFLFPIHPMRVGNTLMSAFLFNCALILICCFAVVQFCTRAFNDYCSQSTAINSMFALSVNYLRGLRYIFIGYNYALFIMVFLTAIYFALKPKDKPAIDQIK